MSSNKLLGERYQVVEVLSQGAFCQTYLVEDTHLAHSPICIVKHFLPSNKYFIPVEIRRRLFKREVEALDKLKYYELVPHLLAHFEDNLEFYLVQEFIEGHTLSAELFPGHCWSESKVFQLLQEVLSILDFVHSCGLIHRDVKPSNIIRRQQDNRLVLIDFGAVKPIWDQLVVNRTKTAVLLPIEQHTTIAIGTPGYMPSEQQRGKPRPNSDIYALGMIGIQALTGIHPTKLPEDAHTGEIIWQDFVQVSHEMAAILNKMVHYHFQDRYNSARQALNDLLTLSHLYRSTQHSDTEIYLSDSVSNATYRHSILEETISMECSNPIPLPEEMHHQAVDQNVSKQLLANQASNTTVYIYRRKFALILGLITGVFSGLVLLLVSYWTLQIVAPSPRVENWQMQIPGESR